MFPYRDDNPTLRMPVVTIALVVANVVAWILVQGAGEDRALLGSICSHGLVPGELLGRLGRPTEIALGSAAVCRLDGIPHTHTLLSSMFLHGGWSHLLGNMWFLWLFGNNVEDSMGRLRFAGFYLLCGLAAAAAQIASGPASVVPMVGASGAIGGVLGAYILLYPNVRVHVLIVLGLYVTTIYLPAYLMLGWWFVLQLLGGLPQLGGGHGSGVAFWAHIGGFGAGFLLVRLFANPALVAAHRRATGVR